MDPSGFPLCRDMAVPEGVLILGPPRMRPAGAGHGRAASREGDEGSPALVLSDPWW